MKAEFTPGRIVRFNIPDGALARIKQYLQEGFYNIETIPEQRDMIAHEDDLVTAELGKDYREV